MYTKTGYMYTTTQWSMVRTHTYVAEKTTTQQVSRPTRTSIVVDSQDTCPACKTTTSQLAYQDLSGRRSGRLSCLQDHYTTSQSTYQNLDGLQSGRMSCLQDHYMTSQLANQDLNRPVNHKLFKTLRCVAKNLEFYIKNLEVSD